MRQYVPLDAFQPGTDVTVRAVSANVSTRLQVTTRTDTDGDGLWNAWENKTYAYEHLPATDSERNPTLPAPEQHFNTSWQDPDTDDDGVSDGQEYSVRRLPANDTRETARLVANSTTHPTMPDTDGDGLLDDESRGWNITVVESTSGAPYRYYNRTKSDEPTGGRTVETVRFSSDPLSTDTDDDGLTDGVERNRTHTDPRSRVTYVLTGVHQQMLEKLVSNGRRDAAVDMDIVERRGRVDDLVLTDRTDDFDFVRPDGGKTVVDRLDFTALDGTTRTDTWLSNEEELRWSVFNAGELGVWDPDTDDDGLTDGQEVNGLTKVNGRSVVKTDESVSYGTDPTDADTDGDGYWDGWIGVYGVEWSDNVVLYQEHLSTGDGIEGDEVVSEQAGIHNVSIPITGADIDGDNNLEHSNIHIGELHWGTAPETPTPSLDQRTTLHVEVDWIEGQNPYNETIGGQSLLDSIEENYALYGLNIVFHRDDRLTTANVTSVCKQPGVGPGPTCGGTVTLPGLNAHELDKVEDRYHDDTSRHHILFATNYAADTPILSTHDPFMDSDVDGLEGHTGSPGQRNLIPTAPYGSVILADQPELSDAETLKSTTMHELGHGLGIGWLDDKGPGHIAECYSGDFCVGQFGVGGGDDETPERIEIPGRGIQTAEWSIMGETGDPIGSPFETYRYSIEELLTIDFNDVPSTDD
ncbi:hypothetical protein [Halosimplex pelagicum]|uniref:Uncharacterized protein n=1 Tax=Halosimplex pelagicum TaxID=869886 RepID=A0A7D5SUX3_9EURY|nr:hypothetical protein [Halosimplex pelagicum]QLH81747.1 hypothetical protein HZS54_08955 [Halosimplex pelagicum]